MYCNNCGAEVTPEQKFCNNCGVALNPQITYRPQGQQPPRGQLPPQGQIPPMQARPQQPMQPGQGQPPVPPMQPGQGQPPMQPGMPPMNQPPKKKPVWPIILIIVIVLLLVSVLSVWGVNKLYKSIKAKYLGSNGSPIQAHIDTDFDVDFDSNILDEHDEILDEIEEQKEDMLEQFGIDDEFGDFDLDEFSFEGEDYSFKDYDYASIVQMDDFTYVETRNKIDDDTMLRPGKTMGALCDYIDSEVLEKGKKIDRDLLYDLVSVHVIDNDFVKDDKDLEKILMYCLSFANEFSGQGIMVSDVMYENNGQDQYYYSVTANNEYDSWIVNLEEGKIYMGYGDTEYTSAGQYGMFSEETYAVWVTVIDLFYEID